MWLSEIWRWCYCTESAGCAKTFRLFSSRPPPGGVASQRKCSYSVLQLHHTEQRLTFTCCRIRDWRLSRLCPFLSFIPPIRNKHMRYGCLLCFTTVLFCHCLGYGCSLVRWFCAFRICRRSCYISHLYVMFFSLPPFFLSSLGTMWPPKGTITYCKTWPNHELLAADADEYCKDRVPTHFPFLNSSCLLTHFKASKIVQKSPFINPNSMHVR